MTTDQKTYQGWANYETWAVALWIDNEEGLYHERMRLVQEVGEDHDAIDRPYRVADALKDWVEEMAPDLGATLWSDLLSAALSEVDWHEIAEHWLEDAEFDEQEEAEA